MPRALAAVLSLLLLAPAGEPVARVLGSRGTVQVKRAGQQLEALGEGAALYEPDVLVVPPGGLLVLRVERNEQLVRVDEDVEMPVAALAALRAPRATLSLEQQLSQLLTPREQQALGRERLAGWVVRPHAANAAPAGPESAAAREALKALIEEKRRERELDRRVDRLTRDDGLFDDADRRLTRTEQRTEVAAESPGSTFEPRSPSTGTVTGTDARVQVGSTGRSAPGDEDELEALEAQLRSMESAAPRALDDATRTCLLRAVEALTVEARAALGDALSLTLRREGAALSVTLEAGLPVPGCVQAWAASAGAGLGEGEAVVLEVALP